MSQASTSSTILARSVTSRRGVPNAHQQPGAIGVSLSGHSERMSIKTGTRFLSARSVRLWTAVQSAKKVTAQLALRASSSRMAYANLVVRFILIA